MSRLLEALLADIRLSGPLRLDVWMARCLDAYYAGRDPLGASGDFTTAPEISQMFGELCGLWLAQAWRDAGAPSPFALAEAGPGRGTLMADILRAGASVPGFVDAARVHLVETSPTLRKAQAERLARHGPVWHDRLETVPEIPLFLIANEFFDALPIRQFRYSLEGWRERMVGAEGEALVFGLSPPLPDIPMAQEAPLGTIREICPAGLGVAAQLGERLGRDGGAALIVDYGYLGAASGDTLQALRHHTPADPLLAPGEADLTAHVDFPALAGAAGIPALATTQGAFLEALGIGARAAALTRRHPERAAEIEAARERLTGPQAMGALFKVMALLPAGAPTPPGFAGDTP